MEMAVDFRESPPEGKILAIGPSVQEIAGIANRYCVPG